MSYNAYDYDNTNYLLNFGAAFLEAYRPLNGNLQTWGHIRTKSPKTKVTVVDIRVTTTGAAADHLLLVKPGTDGALALAFAHVILTEGLWDKKFVGDFKDGVNAFKTGQTLDPASFSERWTKGLIEWWNAELKDRRPSGRRGSPRSRRGKSTRWRGNSAPRARPWRSSSAARPPTPTPSTTVWPSTR